MKPHLCPSKRAKSIPTFSPPRLRSHPIQLGWPGVALVCWLAAPFGLWAATYVNRVGAQGQVQDVVFSQDVVFQASQSPYIIEAHVTARGALRIEPGVVVQVSGGKGIYVEGLLGATNATFTVNGAGNWRGIYLGPSAGGSILSNCTLQATGATMDYLHGDYRSAALYVDGCSPAIVGCVFQDQAAHGIELWSSQATLRNNTFNNVGANSYPIVLDTLDSFPVMGGNVAAGAGQLGVGVPSGTIAVSGTWSNPGDNFPYLLNGDLSLAADATWHIAPGATLKGTGNAFRVEGTLTAVGTATTPITFTSRKAAPAPGDWEGLYFGPAATNSQLGYVNVAFGGARLLYVHGDYRYAAVYVDGSNPKFDHLTISSSSNQGLELYSANLALTHSVISNCVGNALRAYQGSHPTLLDVQFSSNGLGGSYVISMDAGSVPDPSQTVFTGNLQTGIEVRGGSLPEMAIWKSWATNAPYVIRGEVEVPAAGHLTILPATTVKVQATRLMVNGTLTADGTAAPIVITSWTDDAVAGDSNGDGTQTQPAGGDWKGIYLSADSGASILKNCTFRYAGGNNLGYIHGDYRYTTLFVDTSAPEISGCTFADSAGHGIELYAATPWIHDSVFQNLGSTAYAIRCDTVASFPRLAGITVTGTGLQGLSVPRGTLSGTNVWTNPGAGLAYYLDGEVAVDETALLIIESGVTVKSSGQRFMVYGTLRADGTAAGPILFTSRNAAPAPGDWLGIYFGPSAGNSQLSFVTVAYAGGNNLGYIHSDYHYTAVYLDTCSPQMDHVTIDQSKSDGVELYAANPNIVSGLFAHCGRWALRARTSSRPTLVAPVFANNGTNDSGYYTLNLSANSIPSVSNPTFTSNRLSGLQVEGGDITTNALWQNWATNAPYVLTSDVTVGAGLTLTLQPGAVVKFKYTGLYVDGTLTAQGAPGRIYFTSWSDDTEGGDSNGDAAASTPAPGDWKGLYLASTAGGSVLDNCSLRFAGRNNLGYINNSYRLTTVYLDGCSATVTNCFVGDSGGHGLELFNSTAAVQATTFNNVASGYYAVAFDSLAQFPNLSGNSVTGTGVRGIYVPGGTIATASTWRYPGPNFPYILGGHLSVGEAVVLALEPGVTVEAAQRGIYVSGTLLAAGTASLPIQFTSAAATPAAGDWLGIYFGPKAGQSVLSNVTVAHAGGANLGYFHADYRYTAIFLDTCSPQFDHLTITNSQTKGLELFGASPLLANSAIELSGDYGLVARSGSRPRLRQVILSGNGDSEDGYYTVGMDASAVPDPVGVVFVTNKFQGVRVWGGTLDSDALWKNWATNAPYVITSDTSVAAGTTLTIEPGTVIKFAGVGLFVSGTLIADGSSAPIQFSSWRDDTVGGDSNGDGATTLAAPGDWKGLYLSVDSGASVLKHCSFRYGSASNLGYLHSDYRTPTIYVDGCSPIISQCTVADAAVHGLELWSSQAVVRDCVLTNFGASAYPIVLDSLDSYPELAGNSAGGTGQLGVRIGSGGMSTSGAWSNPGTNLPYVLTGDLTINDGQELVLEPGVQVVSGGPALYVQGKLTAVGTATDRIVFSSRNANPAPGDWTGLYFGPKAGGSLLAFCTVSFAGGGNFGYLHSDYRSTALYLDGCSPTLADLIVERSYAYGLELYGSAALIQSSLIRSNGWPAGWSGVRLSGGSTGRLINATIVDSGASGLSVSGSAALVANCIIAYNNANGIRADGSALPTLRNNCAFGNQISNYVGVASGSADISVDPQFVDRPGGNFHLSTTSPALGRGDATLIETNWVDLDGRLRTVGGAVDLGAYESGAAAASRLVDGLIRNQGDAAYIGEGVFVGTNQVKTQTVIAGTAATYQFQVKYSGNVSDSVRLTGTTMPPGWSVKYFNALTGGEDITGLATAFGGYVWTNLSPGAVKEFRAEVTPASNVSGNSSQAMWITVASEGDPARQDMLGAVTVNAPQLQPDLMLRREADLGYVGANIFNATGAGQTKAQETAPGLITRYFFQLVNRGNVADQYRVRLLSSAGGAGWTARFYDSLTGTNDITAGVLGVGWVSPSLDQLAVQELRIEVVAATNATGGSSLPVLLGVSSLTDASKGDVAQAITTLAVLALTPQGGLYTLDADFEKGSLDGVQHDTVHDQMQLARESITLPFIWVPNSNEGTVSKVDTRTGRELGRYRTGPSGNGNPSRTTVDQRGNCWVANRQTATVVKIGLVENGQFADRNQDGVAQTSRDTNGDGDITGAELLPWGQDECVLLEVVVLPGKEGTYAPGTYTGGYADDYWNPGPRGVAVDAKGNVWVGTYGSETFYYLDGLTGTILKKIDVSSVNHTSYGAVVDAQGIVWSAGQDKGHLLRLNPADFSFTTLDIGHYVYGLGLDRSNHLFIAGWQDTKLSRVNVSTGKKEWTKDGINESRGVAVTDDGDVWVANSTPGTVARWSNDGVLKGQIAVGAVPTGVAVDAAGKVWAVNNGDEYIKRIDPTTGAVDLAKRIVGGTHYGYSDMTGAISRNTTTRFGTWTVVHDSRYVGTQWRGLAWNGTEPPGTALAVKARSSADRLNWSAWAAATNNLAFNQMPSGRYLQIEVSFQSPAGEASPVLEDLTVNVEGLMPAPVITSALSVTGQVGVAFSYQITASDNPTGFGAAQLPPGLSVEASSGLISGTPMVAGTYAVALSASNASGTGTATLNLVIAPAAGPMVVMTPNAAMNVARMSHVTITLPDGRVAVVGGHGTGFIALNSLEVWSAESNAFTLLNMPHTMDGGAVVRLADGRYLMVGGAGDSGVAPGHRLAQIYDPAQNQVTALSGTMTYGRCNTSGALLTNGKVLIAGGWYSDASATYGEVFDPTTGQFTATTAMVVPRSTAVVLPTADGKAVVAGGMDTDGSPSQLDLVELYDPATNGFSRLADSLFAGETGWAVYGNSGHVIDDWRMNDGRYALLAFRKVGQATEWVIALFDPASRQFAKMAMQPAFVEPLTVVYGVMDAAHGVYYFMAGTNSNQAANFTYRVYGIDLATGQRVFQSNVLTIPDYYPGGCAAALLHDGRWLVTGGTTSVDFFYNFNPVNKSFLLSGLPGAVEVGPRLTLTSTGGAQVLISWPSGLTGFVLESTDSLSGVIQWAPVANVTGNSHSVDASTGARFYRLRK